MITLPAPFVRVLHRIACPVCVLALSFAVASCEKTPLLAPSGSTITLVAPTNALPLGGSTTITAQVIEASGNAPHSGTQVSFTTSLGTISPALAETDVNGQAIARFIAGDQSGTATISAISGGASVSATGAIRISVGTAAVGRVVVSANPASVSQLGGTTTITATVVDVNGNALPNAPVLFTTTAGTLTAASVQSDQNGNAQTQLNTSQQATVTASVGAQAAASTGGGTTGTGSGTTGTGATGGSTTSAQTSGSVTVTVTASPSLLITPPTTSPSVGLPAAFTFAVTVPTGGSAVAVRNVNVTWGDGTTQSLGAITGSAVVNHVYNRTGSFQVSATLVDAAGVSNTVSTSVTVIPVAKPTLILSYSPIPAKVNTSVNIVVQVTVPNGISVQDVAIDFGDGSRTDIGGATSASVPHVYSAQGTYTVTVTVTDSSGQTTIGTLSISVGV